VDVIHTVILSVVPFRFGTRATLGDYFPCLCTLMENLYREFLTWSKETSSIPGSSLDQLRAFSKERTRSQPLSASTQETHTKSWNTSKPAHSPEQSCLLRNQLHALQPKESWKKYTCESCQELRIRNLGRILDKSRDASREFLSAIWMSQGLDVNSRESLRKSEGIGFLAGKERYPIDSQFCAVTENQV
jgi:hypothetical protein